MLRDLHRRLNIGLRHGTAQSSSRIATSIAVAAALLLAFTGSALAQGLTPGDNTPFGVPEIAATQPPGAQPDNAIPNYVPPFGGYYYIAAPAPCANWGVVPQAPPWAADQGCIGNGVVYSIGGQFAKMMATKEGWVRVDAVGVASSYYRFYRIKTVEDDVGGYDGYDPRYGVSVSPPGPAVEEGGAGELPAAESYFGYDDRYQYGGTVAWDGLMKPRTSRWLPEMELKPDPSSGVNSIVAGMRDNQYVRVWLYGPSENMPIPVFLHCHPNGSGETEPGRTSQSNPDWQVMVTTLTAGVVPPPLGGAGGTVPYPSNTTIVPRAITIQRCTWTDQGPKPPRKWMIRVPWRGKVKSSTYADIEVEVQIPNPAQIAMYLGLDPTGMQEGSMQFRFGTVIELSSIKVTMSEPADQLCLKEKWYRKAEYAISGGGVTPDMVTLSFGAKVTNGAGDPEADSDTAMLGALKNDDDDLTDDFADKYIADEESTVNAVNRQFPGGTDYAHWLVADLPEAAREPWYDGEEVTRPSSVQCDVRGYAGIIERGPGGGDFDAEPPEAGTSATRTIETHFINVVADANNDGEIDEDDDDDEIEEGQGSGNYGVLVNTDPNAGYPGLEEPDPNLREVKLHFSTPATSYSSAKIYILGTGSLSNMFFWKDSTRSEEFDMSGDGYCVEVPQRGDTVSVWIGARTGAPGTQVLQFFLGLPDNQAGGSGNIVYAALDEIRITMTGAGLDVDSNNDGSITIYDDSHEEGLSGLIVVKKEGLSFDLAIRQHSYWTQIESPVATLFLDGDGAVVVKDGSGQVVLTGGNPSAELSSSDVDGTGTTTYTIEGETTGEAKLTLQIASGETVLAQDWVQLTVVKCVLKEVSFSGAGYHTLKKDDGSVSYSAPHWTDNNEDGDAVDSGERHYGVCFEQATTVKAAAKVDIGVRPYEASIILRGEGPDDLDFEPESLDEDEGILSCSATDASRALGSHVDFMDPMIVTWYVSFDNGETWIEAGTSANRVYVTYGEPTCSDLFESLFYIGCGAASGEVSSTGTFSDIWSKVATRSVTRVDSSTAMTYFDPSGSFETTIERMTTADLLKYDDGQCGAWSRFFADLVKAQGISGAQVVGLAANRTAEGIAAGKRRCYAWWVNNWDLSEVDSETELPVPGEEADQTGAPAQANADPPSRWLSHVIVKYGGYYFDPSYGIGWKSTLTSYEDATVAGYIHVRFTAGVSEEYPEGQWVPPIRIKPHASGDNYLEVTWTE